MERIGTRPDGGADDGLDVEEVERAFTLGRGLADLHAEALRGAPDAASDLAPIRDEQPPNRPPEGPRRRDVPRSPVVRRRWLGDDERV
jgi:hypothetical protein